MQRTWGSSLVREDSTRHGAIKPRGATTTEFVLWSPQAATAESMQVATPEVCTPWGLCSATRGATATRSLRTATKESSHAATQTQHSQKERKMLFKCCIIMMLYGYTKYIYYCKIHNVIINKNYTLAGAFQVARW